MTSIADSRQNGPLFRRRFAELFLSASLIAASAAAQESLVRLPPPSGAPQSIVAEGDPLIGFLSRTDPAGAFRPTVSQAIKSHPSVRQSLAVRQEVAQDKVDARAELLPQVSFDVASERSLARNFGQDSGNLIERSRPKSRIDALLRGEQLLFDFGASFSRIDAATARIKAAEADSYDTAAAAATNAVAAYYEVLTNQILISLARSYIEQSRNILEDTRFRFDQGVGPAGDVIRVEGHVASAEGTLSDLERQLDTARSRYLEAFGHEPAATLLRPERPAPVPSGYGEAVAASHETPLVAAAEALVEAARREQRATRAERLPRLSGVVDAARYDIFGDGDDYDVRGRLVVSQRLFGRGATSAQVGRADARLEQAELTLEQTINEAERDAGIAFRNLEALSRQVETLSRTYIAHRRTRDLLIEQQKASRGNLIDLLRAEQDYFEAAAGLVRGVGELDLAHYVLLARSGGILAYFNAVPDFGGAPARQDRGPDEGDPFVPETPVIAAVRIALHADSPNEAPAPKPVQLAIVEALQWPADGCLAAQQKAACL